jgi:hypothetical protein
MSWHHQARIREKFDLPGLRGKSMGKVSANYFDVLREHQNLGLSFKVNVSPFLIDVFGS